MDIDKLKSHDDGMLTNKKPSAYHRVCGCASNEHFYRDLPTNVQLAFIFRFAFTLTQNRQCNRLIQRQRERKPSDAFFQINMDYAS